MIFRLKSELKKLRKKYERETEKSKKEFMNIHSKKVKDFNFYSIARLLLYTVSILDFQRTGEVMEFEVSYSKLICSILAISHRKPGRDLRSKSLVQGAGSKP